MSQILIRTLLEQRLQDWASVREIPVQWQGQAFTPPNGEYLRFFLLPAPTDSEDLAAEHRLYTGAFQISVVWPKDNTGVVPAESMIEALELEFPSALRLASGNFVLTLTSPLSAAPNINEPDRHTTPLTGRYRADTYTTD